MPSVTTFTGDQRRFVPYGRQAGGCSLKVPLYTDRPEGEWMEGRFPVPTRLAHTQAHTNDRHEFEGICDAAFKRWTEWRARKGWDVVPKTLRVDGPSTIPVARTGDEGDEEQVLFHFYARFRRNAPVYVGLDDFLEVRRLAEVYQIETPADPVPWNVVTTRNDTGWVDPMVEAEQERKRLGIKREDYLLGPLEEPWRP